MKQTYSRTVAGSAVTVDVTYNQNTNSQLEEARFIEVLLSELGYRKIEGPATLTLADIRARLQNIDR